MTEFDILSDAFYDDPYPVFAAMRKEAPCYYDARLEAHVLTRYHDVERALTDIDTFSARRVKQWGKGAPEEGEEKFTAVAREMETWVPFLDPPEHTPLRARLTEYYMGVAKDDELVIELPKGGYIPRFRQAEAARETAAHQSCTVNPRPLVSPNATMKVRAVVSSHSADDTPESGQVMRNALPW